MPAGRDDRNICPLLITGNPPTVFKLLWSRIKIIVCTPKDRIQPHFVSCRVSNEHIQFPIFNWKYISKASRNSRIGGAFILEEIQMFHLLEIQRAIIVLIHQHLPIVLIGNFKYREALFIQPYKRNGKQPPVRIPFPCEPASWDESKHEGAGVEFRHLRLAQAENQIGTPLEPLVFYILGRKGKFKTVWFHGSHIPHTVDLSSCALCTGPPYKVKIVSLIPVGCQIYTVIQESHIHAYIQFVFFLIGKGWVFQIGYSQAGLCHTGRRTPWIVTVDDNAWVCHPSRTGIGSKRIRGFQGQVRESRLQFLKKLFLVHVPGCRHIPCRQPACGTGLTQTVAAFITQRTGQRVSSLVWIGSCSKKCDLTVDRIAHAIIIRVTFPHSFEGQIIKKWEFTVVILHSPAFGPVTAAFLRIHFSSRIGIQNMGFIKLPVIGSRQTEVITEHFILVLIVKASLGKNTLWQSIRFLRIFVKPWVGIYNSGIPHGTVCKSLIGHILYLVVLRYGGILQCTEKTDLDSCLVLPFEFSLEF